MKYIDWNEEKNKKLKSEREVGFEEIAVAIVEKKNILDVIEHPNKKRYPNQKILIINIDNYAYLVPYVEDEEKIFLKTIIPNREATKKYIIKGGKK